MSELKPCPFCGLPVAKIENEDSTFAIDCYGCQAEFGLTTEEWNKRHDPNPWRYPSRGEWPEEGTGVLATYLWPISAEESIPVVGDCLWMDGQWRRFGQFVAVRAWKAIGEPAPELEVTE